MGSSPAGSCPWGFSMQEYWSGLPCPSPGNLPNPWIKPKPRSPAFQEDSLTSEPAGKPKNTGVCSLSLPPGDLADPGIEPESPALKADSLPAELPGKPIKWHTEIQTQILPSLTAAVDTQAIIAALTPQPSTFPVLLSLCAQRWLVCRSGDRRCQHL